MTTDSAIRIYNGMGIPIPMLALDTYVSFLEEQKQIGLNIGDQANKVLIEFSDEQHRSTYIVYSNFDRKLDYKNTHKRVKRLETLGFIESLEKDVTVEESRHGAKYYRITEAGMFQLFLLRDWWIPYELQSRLPKIIGSHGDYLIFKTLLYPNFMKETLPELPNLKSYEVRIAKSQVVRGDPTRHLEILEGTAFQVTKAIYHYLRNCCTEVFKYVITLRKYRTEVNHTLGEKVRLDEHFRSVRDYIFLERDQLVMKIILLYQTYKLQNQRDTLAILAHDDKFMKVADDLHKSFEKSFRMAMNLRTSP